MGGGGSVLGQKCHMGEGEVSTRTEVSQMMQQWDRRGVTWGGGGGGAGQY